MLSKALSNNSALASTSLLTAHHSRAFALYRKRKKLTRTFIKL